MWGNIKENLNNIFRVLALNRKQKSITERLSFTHIDKNRKWHTLKTSIHIKVK